MQMVGYLFFDFSTLVVLWWQTRQGPPNKPKIVSHAHVSVGLLRWVAPQGRKPYFFNNQPGHQKPACMYASIQVEELVVSGEGGSLVLRGKVV